MNTYFPQFKAFWAAENITGTIHNIYTLRGAGHDPRDVDQPLARFRLVSAWIARRPMGMKFVINLVTPDNGEKYVVEHEQLDAHQHQGPTGEELRT